MRVLTSLLAALRATRSPVVDRISALRIRWLRMCSLALLGSATLGLLLEGLPYWLRSEDPLAPADAILVLYGDEVVYRLAYGAHLMRHGYGRKLILIQNSDESPAAAERSLDPIRDNQSVYRLYKPVRSTREEAVEARQVLTQLGVKRLLIITSSYHTRRARLLFSRALRGAGIEFTVHSAPLPHYDEDNWWLTRGGRRIVVSESVKLLAIYLHVDLPVHGDRRERLKRLLVELIP